MLETSNVFQPSVMDFGEQFDNSFIGFEQNEHDSMDMRSKPTKNQAYYRCKRQLPDFC